MKHILVYADSLSWGLIPNTRQRLPFEHRWPGVMEIALNAEGYNVRVIEDCLNGRRTVWDDPFKAGRKGLDGLSLRIEIHSPLELVILMLGTNDFQITQTNNAFLSAQGIAALIGAVRNAPIEPGMPVPPVLVVAPPLPQEGRGTMAPRFAGCRERCEGLSVAYKNVCELMNCAFFDAGEHISVSLVDGVHADKEQHITLGKELATFVAGMLKK